MTPNPTHFPGDLRAALLAAAEAEVEEQGLRGLRLRAVARRAGVSHAAPANHFDGVRGLLTALAARAFALFGQELGQALTGGESTDPKTRLLDLGLAYVRFALERPGLFEVMWADAHHDPDDPELQAAGSASLAVLLAFVREAQADGWAAGRDPALVATLLWSLIHGMAELWRRGPLRQEIETPDAESLARALASLAWDLLAQPVATFEASAPRHDAEDVPPNASGGAASGSGSA